MSNTNTHTKVLIIGSGPAGYTAAIYAARANLNPILVTGYEPGGQLMITTEVENYPGFAEKIEGPWLVDQMRAQAENVGTEMISDYIVDVDTTQRPFKATGQSGEVYTGDTLIIATGAKARWLGIESEQTFQGRGVSACATCDGFFFKNQEVAIVGGGNSAVEEALFLTNFCSKVTLIHRRDSLRAEKIMQDRLFASDKVSVIWDHEVDEILGDDTGVTGLRLKSTKDDSTQNIDVQGFFVAIGHDPATELFKGKLDMDESGYLITAADSTKTSIDGIYGAGDVADHTYRQAITAAGMGCMAALEADRFLAAQDDE
ncbi:MAG: thioredoxin-disulfide reductase [Alphaproteobacteria bacterium]|nr:thioredoxin-disulfide reductase [Alphaproteobacteria bacterium]|tara:strand:- start:22932 stop:23879 length:948 start_codon:yes stop_codon:yes gene_type:complete